MGENGPVFDIANWLGDPVRYGEWHVRLAIEAVWSDLFPEVWQVQRTGIKGMRGRHWLPDLVGYTKHDFVLAELKIIDTPLRAARQVVRYAREFHAVHPDLGLRLLVIGPWKCEKKIDVIQQGGYAVGKISLGTLAKVASGKRTPFRIVSMVPVNQAP